MPKIVKEMIKQLGWSEGVKLGNILHSVCKNKKHQVVFGISSLSF
jgi:hypothetical protein